jgi:hypothetical protein
MGQGPLILTMAVGLRTDPARERLHGSPEPERQRRETPLELVQGLRRMVVVVAGALVPKPQRGVHRHRRLEPAEMTRGDIRQEIRRPPTMLRRLVLQWVLPLLAPWMLPRLELMQRPLLL